MEIKALPESLDQALTMLELFFQKDLEEIKNMSEEKFTSSTHFFSGMYIRNEWQLWWHEDHGYDGWSKDLPKLNAWFRSIGIYHADDMSAMLITTLHRKLSNKPYDIEKQVEKYHKHWK